MRWCDYYERINDWAVSTAVNRISSLEDMGASDEIVDALNIIAFEDEKGATRLLNRAVQYGVKFSGENLAEIAGLCAEESFKKALYQSADVFTAQDLEDLYCCVDDELIVELAKQYKISAPTDIAGEYEEEELEDVRYEVHSAINAADYALECLTYAQRAMNHSGSASVLDMFTTGFFTSFLKQATLSEADAEVRQAQIALNTLNVELRELSKNKMVQLKYAPLATVIDLWLDDGFLDAVTHLQINKAQKRIRQAITQVEKIKRELRELL